VNVKNLLILSLSSLLISGCSLNPFSGPEINTIEIQAKAVERQPLALKEPKPVTPNKIEWFIITPENYEEVFAKMEKGKFDLVLYGLTDEDYQDLSSNLAKLRQYILQQKAIIAAYKEYYESDEKSKD